MRNGSDRIMFEIPDEDPIRDEAERRTVERTMATFVKGPGGLDYPGYLRSISLRSGIRLEAVTLMVPEIVHEAAMRAVASGRLPGYAIAG